MKHSISTRPPKKLNETTAKLKAELAAKSLVTETDAINALRSVNFEDEVRGMIEAERRAA